jgi:hypothetical protein
VTENIRITNTCGDNTEGEGGGIMAEYKNYVKKNVQPMRPYIQGEDLNGVGVPNGVVPFKGGMIAIDPNNEDDKWYVTEKLFKESYQLAIPV